MVEVVTLDGFTHHDRHMIRWEYRTLRRDGLTRPATRRTIVVLTSAGLDSVFAATDARQRASRSPRPDPPSVRSGPTPPSSPHGGAPEVAAEPRSDDLPATPTLVGRQVDAMTGIVALTVAWLVLLAGVAVHNRGVTYRYTIRTLTDELAATCDELDARLAADRRAVIEAWRGGCRNLGECVRTSNDAQRGRILHADLTQGRDEDHTAATLAERLAS